jgi:uncharacterized protein (TIGR03437 family)
VRTVLFSIPLSLAAYSGGPPLRRTGAPGELTCLSANCHAGDRFDNSEALRLSETTYVPGGPPRRWLIRNTDTTARAYGIQLTVRRAVDPGREAGRLDGVEPDTSVLCSDDRLTPPTGCPPAFAVQYFQHTEPKRTGEFSIQWTPPSTNIGDVIVYASANASVAGQRNSRIHLRAFRLTPAPELSLRNAASGLAEFSPGSWISIFGSGLSALTRSWAAEDFEGGRAPRTLGGVEVRIDGQNAFPAYVSPSQINAQSPDGLREGPVRFEVLRDCMAVASGEATVSRTAPAFFLNPDGRYVAALTANSAVGPFRAGATAVLFGTGFPSLLPAGLFPGGPIAMPGAVTVRIGGRPAQVQFAGLVQIGLYQFNIVVPELDPGDHEVSAEGAGWRSAPGPAIRIEPPGQ